MDRASVSTIIYLILGNPDVDLLPETVVDHFIDQWSPIYPLSSRSCMLQYKVVISSAQYIISRLTAEGLTNGYELVEKEGDVTVSQEYDGESPSALWRGWLTDFLKNATDLLPCLRDEDDYSSPAMPMITGTKRDVYENVLSDPNNISNGYRISGNWGERDNQRLDRFLTGDKTFGFSRRRGNR